jgi:hypothetical protein
MTPAHPIHHMVMHAHMEAAASPSRTHAPRAPCTHTGEFHSPSRPPASLTRTPLSTNFAKSSALSFLDMLLMRLPQQGEAPAAYAGHVAAVCPRALASDLL